jgi:hypothetical protein
MKGGKQKEFLSFFAPLLFLLPLLLIPFLLKKYLETLTRLVRECE